MFVYILHLNTLFKLHQRKTGGWGCRCGLTIFLDCKRCWIKKNEGVCFNAFVPLACYLDGKIFEFIQANRGNEIIDKFANELVEELGEQFNLTRQL